MEARRLNGGLPDLRFCGIKEGILLYKYTPCEQQRTGSVKHLRKEKHTKMKHTGIKHTEYAESTESRQGKKLPYPVILASSSPRRREILNQIGIEPTVMPGNLEEQVTSERPDEVVMELSAQKAEHVYNMCRKDRENGSFIVIGSDTVVAAGGKILGKPGNEEEARKMIRLLSGNVHQVYTGVTLIRGDRKITFAEKTEVSVWPMTEEEIEDYIAFHGSEDDGESEENPGKPRHEWEDKAGGYGIQGSFAKFIREIHGDYYNVMGLPASRTYQELKRISEERL